MKKFRIKINGQVYEVEVEEIGSSPGLPAAPAIASPPRVPVVTPPPATPAPAPAPAAAPKAAAAGKGSGAVCAPMPGTILDVRVKAGDNVKAGDVLVILEAMKMENELAAEKAGVVKEVMVAKGQAVNGGDTLVVIG